MKKPTQAEEITKLNASDCGTGTTPKPVSPF